jgi:hypothetical protein
MQGDVVRNRAHAKEVLESNGGALHYHAWTFCGSCMVCGEGCCSEIFDSIEEALVELERQCRGNWNSVEKSK